MVKNIKYLVIDNLFYYKFFMHILSICATTPSYYTFFIRDHVERSHKIKFMSRNFYNQKAFCFKA